MTAIGQPIISDLHDPNVSFEEYLYWAKLTRASEGHDKDYVLFGQTVKKKQPPPAQTTLGQGSAESAKETVMAIQAIAASKGQDSIPIDTNQPFAEAVTRTMPITDEEHFTASRALRTATWGSMFYLLTMDILGPFSVPWGFAAVSTFASFSKCSGSNLLPVGLWARRSSLHRFRLPSHVRRYSPLENVPRAGLGPLSSSHLWRPRLPCVRS